MNTHNVYTFDTESAMLTTQYDVLAGLTTHHNLDIHVTAGSYCGMSVREGDHAAREWRGYLCKIPTPRGWVLSYYLAVEDAVEKLLRGYWRKKFTDAELRGPQLC